MSFSSAIKVIDSHTAGEPTRVVIDGGPDLGDGELAQRLEIFRSQYDDFRKAVILEPRGYEAMVGALLCRPDDSSCETAILFFNNEGFLNMCGHGTIGVTATLSYLNRLKPGAFKVQTPAGIIKVDSHDENEASFTNVDSFVLKHDVQVDAGKFGDINGSIAYGGNWFFIAKPPVCIDKSNRLELLQAAAQIRNGLKKQQFDGIAKDAIDHVQFFEADLSNRFSKNFVVCPGGEFDRSPCGTGTSAVLALLSNRGDLSEGESWTQESLTGGRFEGFFRWSDETKQKVVPTIKGKAFICAESTLFQDSNDPYQYGNEIGPGE